MIPPPPDGFTEDVPTSQSNIPPPPDGFTEDVGSPDGQSAAGDPQGKPQDWISKIYTPAIEGGAMTIGAGGGAALGSPAGPVGSVLAGSGMAAAMLPPAKRFAASIDQMRGINNPLNQPKPLFQQAKDAASDFGEGAVMETGGKVINAGAEAAAPYVKPIFRNVAQKLAKSGSFVSGAKPQDLMQAYDQGVVKTYGAPNLEKAGSIFEDAAHKAGVNTAPTLEATLDPQLTQARAKAMEVGQKLQAGQALTAQEALEARQAVDRISAATPVKDRKTLGALSDLRNQFQDALSQISPDLQDASRTYRQAIVKNNLSKPWPVNKNGTPSKLLPAINAAGSIVAGAAAHNPAVLGTAVAYPLATSPLAAGVTAATVGDASRAVGSIFKSPIGGRTVAAAIGDRTLTAAKAKDYLKQANGDKDKARELARADGWNF